MDNLNVELQFIVDELSRSTKYIFGDRLRRMILYGSYARGNYNEYSDLDIMVLANFNESEKSSLETQMRKIASRASIDYDITISMMLRDEKVFCDRIAVLPYYKNVAAEGVEIYGAEKSPF